MKTPNTRLRAHQVSSTYMSTHMQCQLGITYEYTYNFHLTHHYNKIDILNLSTSSVYEFTLLMITNFRDPSSFLLNEMEILAMDFPPSSSKLIKAHHINIKLCFKSIP